MPTLHIHRLIVVVPQAHFGDVGAWWAANVDSADNLTTWPSLSPTGAAPETHRVTNTALLPAQLRQIVVRVCNLAGVTPPTLAVWNGWSPAEQKAWLAATRNQLYTQTGIWLDLADNTAAWDDPASIAGGLDLLPLAGPS